MSFFGGSNPNMMNGAFYQALLGQMQGGGQGGGMPNMAPQIAQQQKQPINNISPVPQIQQKQSPAPAGMGGAVQAGKNLQTLYGWGKDGYNNINGMFGSNPTTAGANPNAMSGAPVANNASGNSYLAQNTNMAQPAFNAGVAQGGMHGGMNNNQAFFGSQTPTSGMFGPQGATGMGSGGATSNMFGQSGAGGMAQNGSYGQLMGQGMASGTAGSAAADATSGEAADATSSSPSWLSQLWDLL